MCVCVLVVVSVTSGECEIDVLICPSLAVPGVFVCVFVCVLAGMHAYALVCVRVSVCLCVSSRVQMPGHPIYLQCSRQVWGSVADALSSLITEQAQEQAQARHTHTNTHAHTHMVLLGQLKATGNTGRICLK